MESYGYIILQSYNPLEKCIPERAGGLGTYAHTYFFDFFLQIL